MELWDLYTFGRRKTGLTHVRGEAVPQGLGHLVVHVWIRSREGKYLMSQRSASRYAFPLLWETVGGSVVAGEDSLTDEVAQCRWMTRDEIRSTFEAGDLVPTLDYFFDLFGN